MNTCCCGLKRLPSSIRHSLFVFLYLQFAVVAFSQPPPLHVMPLGDSITYGANSDGIGGGYRYPLYIALTNAGYNIDYVGTQTSIPHAGLGAEINHEGHSGWKISDPSIGLYENILGWFASVADPDVILLHIGTNDSGTLSTFSNAVDRLDALITRMAVAKPNAHIIVTSLMKRSAPNYTYITNLFNPFVPGKVTAQAALGRRVTFLDMHAALELSDMYDNLHPNNAGYGKMAAAFFPAVTNIVTPYGDLVPPAVATLKASSSNTLAVTFSKPINLAASPAVANPASWSISPAGAITAVSAISSDLRTVTLTVSGLAPYAISTLAFTGTVTDLVPAAQGGPFTSSLSGTVGTFAATGARVWTGLGSDALWSTAANWTGGTTPSSTETVLFTGSGNNKTNLTLGSGAVAAGLTFAPDASAYTVGLPSETLTLAANAALTLSAGSSNNQSVAGTLLVGGNLNIYNFESSKTLTLNYTNNTSRNIYTYGSGPITFNTLRRPAGTESNENNYIYLHLRSPAPVTCTGPITIGQLWKDSTYPPSELILAPHTTNIICRNDWEFALSGATISGGEGTVLRLLHAQANTPAAIAIQTVNPITISVRLECPTGLATLNKGGGGWTRGTLVLSYPDNLITGAITIDRGNCFQVPFLALNGTPNPLGACTNFNFSNPNDSGVYARLRVTGSSASSTDKAFTVDKDRGVIENAGTGTLTLSGPFSGAGTFVFDAYGDMTLSGVRSGSGGVAKTGAGKLTLTAANTHTGTNFIECGTLALNPGASLGSGPLMLSGGTLALNPAAADGYSASIPAVTLTAASSLTVPAAATASSVTLASLAPSGYTLSVKAPSAGTAANRIFVTGLADGPASGIILNGGPATYSAANGLAPLTLPAAAIVSDTLPDAAGSAATASAAPATSFFIAQSLTTLGQFNYTAATPATLDLGGGVLALNYLNASPSALAVVNGTLTAAGAIPNINYPGLRTIRVVPLTSDAATGLSTSKTYSHLLDFGNQTAASINGVTFTKGAANGTDTGYSGFPNGNGYDYLNSWTNTLPPATCSGLVQLLRDMNYAGDWTGQLTGLTPGAIYEVTLYFRAWDPPPSTTERRCLYRFYSASSSQPDSAIVYASQPNSANAIVYRYMAPSSGTLKIAVTAVSTPTGCFGLSNERLVAAAGTPPSSGSLAVSGPLSISAALADNGAPTALTATGSDPLMLSGPISLTGSVLLDAPLTLAPDATVTQAFNGPVSGNAAITLNGAGRTILNTANPAFTGPVIVSNGVLEIAHSQSLGSSTKPDVTVTAGGSLAIGQAVNSAVTLAKTVTIAGSGPDGLGALRFDYDNLQNNAFYSLTLANDASVGGTAPLYLPYSGTRGRFDIRNGTIDFGGHSLAKVGSSSFIISNAKTAGLTPGAAINVQSGVLGLEGSTDLGGSVANTASVAAGANFDLNATTVPVNWTLALTNGSHLAIRSGATNQNVWAGPVTLAGGQAILDGQTSYAHHSIAGQISGPGGLIKSFGGYTYLLNPANTFSGPIAVTNSLLHAYAPGSVPTAPAALTVSGAGEFAVRCAADGWTRSQIETLASSGAFQSRTAYLGIDTADADLAYTADWPAFGLAKLGPYALTPTGNWPSPAGIRIHDGTLNLGGFNGGALNLGAYGVQVGFDNWAASCGILPLSGTTSLTTDDYGYNRAQPSIGVGTLGSSRGVLKIDNNAFIKGRLFVGRDGGSAGAIYQTGGVFLNTGGAAADGRIGESGFGYYEISGGSLTNKGYTQLSYNTSAYGTLRVKGEGRVQFNSGSTPAQGSVGDYYGGNLATRAGYGDFHLSGNGTLDTGTAALNLCEWDVANNYNSGYGFLTLEENSRVSANAVILANRNSGPLSVVTLKGGVLDTRYLQKGGNNAAGNNAQVAVNFDGGTLSVRETGSAIRTGANNTPALLTVHPGGAVINTPAGIGATLDLPLTPAGIGVSFIEINSQGSGYIAPPAVLITGGGGTGAVAEAVLNSGKVTGFRILSPGSSYTSSPTVSLNGGGPLSAASIRSVTLGLPSALPGGLVKTGSGTLTLTATNSYRGSTTVAGGTLVSSVAGSLPASSDITLSGGALVLGGRAYTNLSTRVSGSGALAGGSLITGSVVKDGSGTFDLSTLVTQRISELSEAVRIAKIPGLREYRLDGSYTNTNGVDTAAFGPVLQLSTRALLGYATSASGGATLNGAWWPDNSVYVYTGYIWNSETTNVTWTFMQNMDDSFLLRLDGAIILNTGFTTMLPYRITGNAGTCCTVTLSPGPHALEVRAGQGGGGVGGYWAKADGSRPAWGIDRRGRNEANTNYIEFATDPGDGTLFTVNNPYADLGVAFAPVSSIVPTLPADVTAGVGDLAKGFSIVYSGTVPTTSDTILSDSFWSVKNTNASNRFDRVAYVMALEHPTYGRQWVWASFEPPFTDRTKLAIPITSKRMCFQRRVNHLTVRASANANVTNVDDANTGNIEWYPNDYNNVLPTVNAFDRGYSGNGALYDFDDVNAGNDGTFYGNVSGYGSFQIHNFGLNQTLFAINHFGISGSTLCLGIGNNPSASANSSGPQLDWTFADNAAQYTTRELYILTRDVAPVTVQSPAVQINEGTLRIVDSVGTLPVPADIRAKVGTLADGYDTVYYSPVQTTATAAYNGTAYNIDNSAATAPFDRVAYFYELKKPSETTSTWVWVSFNAHTQDRTKLGYPNRNGSPFMWQLKVYGMDVRSNSSRVTEVTGANTGNLEIWPSNYGTGGTLGLGGNDGTFDFDDNGGTTNSIGHGCFQIHNWDTKQTLIAISHCGAAGNIFGLGIGNNTDFSKNGTAYPDWTFSDNAADYDVRNLYVFVRPVTSLDTVGRLLAGADVNLAAGAVLDLNASTQTIRSVTGTGTVSNGVLAAGIVLSPAGDGAVGTIALSGVSFSSGAQYHADLGDLLDVTGPLDVTGLIVRINNPAALVRAQTYTLIRTTGGVTGTAALETALPSGWKLLRKGNDLVLFAESGTFLKLK
jgi:autotransporter-associated beta strand protein